MNYKIPHIMKIKYNSQYIIKNIITNDIINDSF